MLSLEFQLSQDPCINPSASSGARDHPLESKPLPIPLLGPRPGCSSWVLGKARDLAPLFQASHHGVGLARRHGYIRTCASKGGVRTARSAGRGKAVDFEPGIPRES